MVQRDQRALHLNILIAEDDPDDAEFLLESMISQESSLVFSTVENGAPLLDFMTAQGKYRPTTTLPDLLIVDVNMPVIDGLSAIRRLQQLKCFNDIPVVVLTTSSDPVLHIQCLDAGARRVFVKPSSVDQMHLITSEIIEICRDHSHRGKDLDKKAG